jgi:hypothetical protein
VSIPGPVLTTPPQSNKSSPPKGGTTGLTFWISPVRFPVSVIAPCIPLYEIGTQARAGVGVPGTQACWANFCSCSPDFSESVIPQAVGRRPLSDWYVLKPCACAG